MAADPLFEIANHSVDHAAWKLPCFRLTPVASQAAKRAEVRDAAAEIQSVSGISPRYFRFPGGCAGPNDVKLVASEGEQPVGWDATSGDAFQSDPRAVVANVLRQTQPGSIIVMHLMGPPNAPAPLGGPPAEQSWPPSIGLTWQASGSLRCDWSSG